MRHVLIQIDAHTRLKLYPEGGMECERRIDSINAPLMAKGGWFIAHEDEWPDKAALLAILESAETLLKHAALNERHATEV